MTWFWNGVFHAFAMLWATFWALVFGFTISAALQVFIRKDQMTRLLGRAGLKQIVIATGFGAASSSCSYAAVAIGRSAFQMGAALVPALAFMFASTNLVVELGAVLWSLMGWRFVLAEVVGALVLIGVMWLLMTIFFPKKLEAQARALAEKNGNEDHCCGHHHGNDDPEPQETGKWAQLANAFWMDWRMLYKEIAIGFLIAGFLTALVPHDWWKILFIETGNYWLRLIENALVGPLIAILSFVCSVGNIPLANLLWVNGISFGGVISFIYADLLIIPIIMIYGKYFGARAAAYIVGIFYVSMVAAGIIVDLLFAAAGFIPNSSRAPGMLEHAAIGWNYTTWLNFIAIAVAIWLWVVKNNRKHGTSGH